MELFKKKERIGWVDLLRVIGVIGIILIHVVSNTINTFGGLSNNSHVFYVFIHYFSSFAVLANGQLQVKTGAKVTAGSVIRMVTTYVTYY